MNSIHGTELEVVCLCGQENFQRVVVQRKPHPPMVTDFVACIGCRAMYCAPVSVRDPPEKRSGHGMGAIGGPPHDSDPALKRDAAIAARDYVKLGHRKR